MNKKPLSLIEPNIAKGATITLVGLGNIGSWLLALLVRMREITHVILIDHDHYDASNLIGQNITPDAVGHSKSGFQARCLTKIRGGDLTITDIARRVELVPLGVIAQSDLIVGAVDSKGARQTLSEIAFHLDTPYLDCGVNPVHSLARLSFFDPRHQDSACMECAWGPNDYAQLDAKKSCAAAATKVPATAGNAHLGSLSASTAASAIHRFLQSGSATCLDIDADTPARQSIIEAYSLDVLRGGLARNRHCRFDHQKLTREFVGTIDTEASLSTFLDQIGASADDTMLSVPGISWIVEHRCNDCANSSVRRPALYDRPLSDPPTCPDCGVPADAIGFSATEALTRSDLLTAELNSSLASFGIEPGDVLAVTTAREGTTRYIELPHSKTPTQSAHAAA